MDINFCQHYDGDGGIGTNQYCRECPRSRVACDRLWSLVKRLSESNGEAGVALPPTNAMLIPNYGNPDLVRLRVNSTWSLPKEDFMHFVSTWKANRGKANQRQDPSKSPSLTGQTLYLKAMVEVLGGRNIAEIKAVRKFQHAENGI